MSHSAYSGRVDALHEYLSPALSSEANLLEALEGAPDELWTAYVGALLDALPAFDLVVTLPRAEVLAATLAGRRGVRAVQAGFGPMREPHTRGERWSLPLAPLVDARAVLLVTPYLGAGLNELEVAALARQGGADAVGLACGLERTELGGRNRLEQQGVAVAACAMVASTPTGLIFERRVPPLSPQDSGE